MKILIVGGVAGGAGTAARLRRLDEFAEIILFEKDEYISYANCGLPYFIGGKIKSKEDLIVQTVEGFSHLFNIDVRTKNQVVSVDTKRKTLKIKNLKEDKFYDESYDSLVLSPGATPIIPKIPGVENNNVYTLRSIEDSQNIIDKIKNSKPKTAAIIGGGFIGIEMAENLMKLGISVSLIDASDHVLPVIDGDMAYDVQNYLRETGLKLYTNSNVIKILENNVILNKNEVIPAEIVLICIGVRPATGFLKGSEIQLGMKGEIIVDNRLRTNISDVYALGDGASVRDLVTKKTTVIPLAGPANKQGRIVADNIKGGNVIYKGSGGTSVLKYFEMTIATTGAKETTLEAENISYYKTLVYADSNASYYPGAKKIFMKILFEKESKKILGAQIVGEKGVDKRIDVLSTALRFGLNIYDLTELELAYAPPFSSAKDPINISGYLGENIANELSHPFYIEDLDLIPKDDSVIRIDIREKEEYDLGNIPGYSNFPLSEIRKNIGRIDLNKPIYLHCQSGKRGRIAEAIFKHHGGRIVKNLIGGYRHYIAMKTDLESR